MIEVKCSMMGDTYQVPRCEVKRSLGKDSEGEGPSRRLSKRKKVFCETRGDYLMIIIFIVEILL